MEERIRLESLVAFLRRGGERIAPQLAALIMVRVARAVGEPGADFAGVVSLRTVVVDRAGRVEVLREVSPLVVRDEEYYRHAAPELARGEPGDARAKVYSLGVIYYELLAGKYYREGLSPTERMLACIEGLAPELPGALMAPRDSLVALLDGALASDREERPLDACLFADDVLRELEDSGLECATSEALSALVARYEPDSGPARPAADARAVRVTGVPAAPPTAGGLAVATPSALDAGVHGVYGAHGVRAADMGTADAAARVVRVTGIPTAPLSSEELPPPPSLPKLRAPSLPRTASSPRPASSPRGIPDFRAREPRAHDEARSPDARSREPRAHDDARSPDARAREPRAHDEARSPETRSPAPRADSSPRRISDPVLRGPNPAPRASSPMIRRPIEERRREEAPRTFAPELHRDSGPPTEDIDRGPLRLKRSTNLVLIAMALVLCVLGGFFASAFFR